MKFGNVPEYSKISQTRIISCNCIGENYCLASDSMSPILN